MPDLDTLLREYFDEIAPAVDVEGAVAERQVSPTRRPPAPIFRSRVAIALTAAAVVILVIGAVAIFSPFGEEPAPVTEPPQPTTVTTLESAPQTTSVTTPTKAQPPRPPVAGVDWARIPDDEAVFGPHGYGIGDIVVGGPGLVAVGNDTSESLPAVWTSPDGISWSRVPYDEAVFGMAETLMHGVAVGGPGLVAIGGQCTEADVANFRCWVPIVWTSEHGVVWTRLPTDEAVFQPESFVSDIEPFDGGLVIVGASCGEDPGCRAAVWASADGITWNRSYVDDQAGEIQAVVAAGPVLVAVGYTCDESARCRAAIWTSEDATAWTAVPYDPNLLGELSEDAFHQIRAVATGGPGVVAVGHIDRRPTVWASPDGLTWSLVPAEENGIDGSVSDLIAGGPGLVAVGGDADGPAVWTSIDGTEWIHDATLSGEFPETVVAFGSGFIVGGVADEGAAVWVSPPRND